MYLMEIQYQEPPSRAKPQDVTVQMNLRVPYFYREQLITEAKARGMSINRLLVNLLVASLPPVRP
jgi:predicted HicB family RNase H-like nuclease